MHATTNYKLKHFKKIGYSFDNEEPLLLVGI